jgi:Excreted virulence factor EspC, type VII ESX diderm
MPDLSVDVAGLRTLSGTLRSVRDALVATRSVVEAGRDEVGSDDVYDALGSFESSWDDGRGQINENMQAMTEILDESAAAYEQTDHELASGLRAQMDTGS